MSCLSGARLKREKFINLVLFFDEGLGGQVVAYWLSFCVDMAAS